MSNLTFKVAGHLFQLFYSYNYFNKRDLFNLEPFIIKDTSESILFSLSILEENIKSRDYRFIFESHDDIASIKIFKNVDDTMYLFKITHSELEDSCILEVDASFTTAKAHLSDNSKLKTFYLNNCLMLLYAFSTASLETLLIHASCIKQNESAFVFLGKSGTGKSTHSRLWLENIENTELLNDDNPILRIINKKVYAFGSPWSGKTDCYKSDKAQLRGILKLQQAPENKIEHLSLLKAYASLLPACSCLKSDIAMKLQIHKTVEMVVGIVSSYHLNCLPDKEAALLSYQGMTDLK